jgi:hypothetical protein
MTQLRTVLQWGLGVLVAVGLLAMADGALGNALSSQAEEVADSTPRVAGASSEFVLALNSFALQAGNASSAASLSADGILRYCSGNCGLVGSVTLPSGAVITGIEVDANDSLSNGQVVSNLLKCPVGASFCSILATATTGGTAIPGVTQVRANLPSPHPVDNGANTYAFQVNLFGGSSNIGLIGVRVFYRLQVSPAPAAATFSDVPSSHPFFQFVEALVASGITVGCGGGLYCVNSPITRGEMAVFLSKALGLHFAP